MCRTAQAVNPTSKSESLKRRNPSFDLISVSHFVSVSLFVSAMERCTVERIVKFMGELQDGLVPTALQHNVQEACVDSLNALLSSVMRSESHWFCEKGQVADELLPLLALSGAAEEIGAVVARQVTSCPTCDESFLASVCRWRKNTPFPEPMAETVRALLLLRHIEWHADFVHSSVLVNRLPQSIDGASVDLQTVFQDVENETTTHLLTSCCRKISADEDHPDSSGFLKALSWELQAEIDSRVASRRSVHSVLDFRDTGNASPLLPDRAALCSVEPPSPDRSSVWADLSHMSPVYVRADRMESESFVGLVWAPGMRREISRGLVPSLQLIYWKAIAWLPKGETLSCCLVPLPGNSHLRRIRSAVCLGPFLRMIPVYRDVVALPRAFARAIHYERIISRCNPTSSVTVSQGPSASTRRRAPRKQNGSRFSTDSLFSNLMRSGHYNEAQKKIFSRVKYILDSQVAEKGHVPCPHADIFSLVQGPPGTGKTKTIVACLSLFCSDLQCRVLVCAPSNMAVDAVLESAVADNTLTAVLDRRSTRIHDFPGLCRLGRPRRNTDVAGEREGDDLQTLHYGDEDTTPKDERRLFDVHNIATRCGVKSDTVIAESAIVFSTLNSAGSWEIADGHFDFLIVDEACQASYVDTFIPFARVGCLRRPIRHVLLVGDRKQLPPTVCSQENGVKRLMGHSLFERLEDHLFSCPVCEPDPDQKAQENLEQSRDVTESVHGAGCSQDASVFILNTQYRMHPFISEFAFKMFYANSSMCNGVEVADRAAIWHRCPLFGPVTFIDTDDYSGNVGAAIEGKGQGPSLSNEQEALIVANLVRRLGASYPALDLSESLGIVTPYREQVAVIRRHLRREVPHGPRLEGRTVDSMQGQERDIIIMSTVRANSAGSLGFLADSRRMNVALTRARMSVVIVGSASTLAHPSNKGSPWAKFIDHCTTRQFRLGRLQWEPLLLGEQ